MNLLFCKLYQHMSKFSNLIKIAKKGDTERLMEILD